MSGMVESPCAAAAAASNTHHGGLSSCSSSGGMTNTSGTWCILKSWDGGGPSSDERKESDWSADKVKVDAMAWRSSVGWNEGKDI